MAKNSKTENGIRYTIEYTKHPSMAEEVVYWRGNDGSRLDLTYEEKVERDTSRSIADK
jgi:hypothetical protein